MFVASTDLESQLVSGFRHKGLSLLLNLQNLCIFVDIVWRDVARIPNREFCNYRWAQYVSKMQSESKLWY